MRASCEDSFKTETLKRRQKNLLRGATSSNDTRESVVEKQIFALVDRREHRVSQFLLAGVDRNDFDQRKSDNLWLRMCSFWTKPSIRSRCSVAPWNCTRATTARTRSSINIIEQPRCNNPEKLCDNLFLCLQLRINHLCVRFAVEVVYAVGITSQVLVFNYPLPLC